jgi:hypothetical protein
MQVFLMHIGHPGHIDVKYTVARRRKVSEVLDRMPGDAAERNFFANDQTFRTAFPALEFHCWGVPVGAEPAFERTMIGDLVLIVPWIGIHDGGIHYIGVVNSKCEVRAPLASEILWPDTPFDRRYPWLFFFHAEAGRRSWYDFLDDVGYDERWNPRGWYRRIAPDRFMRWGGGSGYLEFLRSTAGFHPL